MRLFLESVFLDLGVNGWSMMESGAQSLDGDGSHRKATRYLRNTLNELAVRLFLYLRVLKLSIPDSSPLL